MTEITPQQLFGELVQLVVPHLKRYHRDFDLYWDAQFIQERFEPGFTFYYGVADGGYGTYISSYRELIEQYCSHLWRVTVPTGKADVTITLVKDPYTFPEHKEPE